MTAGMISGTGAFLLSIMMIAVIALGASGMWLITKRRDYRKGILMLVAALALLGNVLIWAWPAT